MSSRVIHNTDTQGIAFRSQPGKPTITIYQAAIQNLAAGSRVTRRRSDDPGLPGVCLLVQELGWQKSLMPNGRGRHRARLQGDRPRLEAGSEKRTQVLRLKERMATGQDWEDIMRETEAPHVGRWWVMWNHVSDTSLKEASSRRRRQLGALCFGPKSEIKI